MFFTEKEMTKDKFRGKSMCHFEIAKTDVDMRSYDNVDRFFKRLENFGAGTARQKVLFTFAGYDDDKRELIYIPEVIRYAKELSYNYPQLWYYATPLNSEFFVLADLLDEKNSVIANVPLAQKFYIKKDAENLKSFLYDLARKLNFYGDKINDTDGALESLKAWSAVVTGSIGQNLN